MGGYFPANYFIFRAPVLNIFSTSRTALLQKIGFFVPVHEFMSVFHFYRSIDMHHLKFSRSRLF